MEKVLIHSVKNLLSKLSLSGFPVMASLLEVTLLERQKEHGKLWVRGILEEPLTPLLALRLEGAVLQLWAKQETLLFSGRLERLHWKEGKQGMEVQLQAVTHSVVWDQKKKSCVFQAEKKTLQEVARQCIGDTGFVQVEPDVSLPDFLQQEKETDWEFLKRLAEENERNLMVSGRSDTALLHLGNAPFAVKDFAGATTTGIRKIWNECEKQRKGIPFLGFMNWMNGCLPRPIFPLGGL